MIAAGAIRRGMTRRTACRRLFASSRRSKAKSGGPNVSGKVAVFVSRQSAEAQSRAAATRWLAALEAALQDARIPYRSRIAVGSVQAMLRSAGERSDIDRVLLGTRERDPLRRWRRQLVAHLMDRPLVSVS